MEDITARRPEACGVTLFLRYFYFVCKLWVPVKIK